MAKTKNSTRKAATGLPSAKRHYDCPECQRRIQDVSNFRRHMAAVHRKNTDGTDADDATVTRYSRYMKRGVRDKTRSTTDVSTTPATAADDPQPSTSTAAAVPMKRRRRVKKSVVFAPGSPKDESPPRSFNVADDLALSSSDDADSSDDYFVDVTDEELTDLPIARKPTRPLPVATAPRRVGGIYAAAVARPAVPTSPAAKRRRLEMAPSVLAQRVIAQPEKSSKDIVQGLASHYSLTPIEQRDRINVVRGMRAMAAAFSARIRRQMPLNRTKADVQQFLTVVETECRAMEGHVFDEFSS